MLFGHDVDFALCAYRPRSSRYERLPKPAATKNLYSSIAYFRTSDSLLISLWTEPARGPKQHSPVCQKPIESAADEPEETFSSCVATAGSAAPSVSTATGMSCVRMRAIQVSRAASELQVEDLEAMYDEVDWASIEHVPMPIHSRSRAARQVEAVRRAPFQLALAALEEDPAAVKAELQVWLGPQAVCLDRDVGLIRPGTPVEGQCAAEVSTAYG